MLSGFAEAFLFTISMSASGVATLRDLLARNSVNYRLLLAAGDPGGMFLWVRGGGGDLPSLSSPIAAPTSSFELVKIVAAVSLARLMSFLSLWGKLFADAAYRRTQHHAAFG